MEGNFIQGDDTLESNPHDGTGAFTGGLTNTAQEPAAAAAIGQFKFKLARNGIHIGWIGLGGSYSMWWCVVTDESKAVNWEWYNDTSGDYLKAADFPKYGTWSTGLAGGPCACNDWAYAGTFELAGGHLLAGGATVGQYKSDLPWLYANSSYTPLQVTAVPV